MKQLILNNVYQETLSRTLQQTKDQLEAKHRLEMDWSDKYSSQHLGITLYSVWCPSIDFLQTQEV